MKIPIYYIKEEGSHFTHERDFKEYQEFLVALIRSQQLFTMKTTIIGKNIIYDIKCKTMLIVFLSFQNNPKTNKSAQEFILFLL